MTQTFVDNTRVPVTVVSIKPNIVTQVITEDKSGYWAVQLGSGTKRIKNVSKPLQGHLKGVIKEKMAPRFLREVRLENRPEFEAGDHIKASDVFSAGDTIAVTGTSKGKGFAGGVKRWGFGGGSKTHGQSDRQRAPGSIGQGTNPGRIWKGKRMAGRMGNETITVKNLHIVKVDDEHNEIYVSGPVPGAPKSLLVIKRTSPAQEKSVEAELVKDEGKVDTAVAVQDSEETPDIKSNQEVSNEN